MNAWRETNLAVYAIRNEFSEKKIDHLIARLERKNKQINNKSGVTQNLQTRRDAVLQDTEDLLTYASSGMKLQEPSHT